MSPQQMLSSLVAFVTVAISSKCCCTATEYYVSAADGPPCPNNTICHPISYYLSNTRHYIENGDIMYFMEGTHFFSKQFLGMGSRGVMLSGLGKVVRGSDGNMQSTSVIKCSHDIAPSDSNDLGLINLSGADSITVSHITIHSCDTFPIALYAYGMMSMTLDHLSVQDSTGGVRIQALAVDILHSSFVHSNVSVVLVGLKFSLPSFSVKSCNVTNAILHVSQTFEYDKHTPAGTSVVAITDTLFSNVQYNEAACVIAFDKELYPHYITIGNSVFADSKFGLALNLRDNNNVTIENSIFRNNSEQSISILVNEPDFSAINVELRNVTIATTGYFGSPFLPVLILKNCPYNGTFILLDLTIIDSAFSNNKNSALYLSNCVSVTFKGTTIFEGNTGYNGGSLVLDTNQRLIVDNTTQLIFTNNHAVNHGGAIYVLPNVNDFGFHNPSHHCFYDYSEGLDIHTIFYFNNNTAGNAGTAIYGSSVTHYCEQQLSFSNISNFTNQPGYSVISSDVSKVCFCDDNSKPLCSTRNTSITATPGQIISFNVTVVGDVDGLADGFLEITDPHSRSDTYGHASTKCISLNYTVYSSTTDVTVNANNPVPYMSPVNIRLQLVPCPDGFYLSSNTSVCQCDSAISSLAECHLSNGMVTRQGNRWLAYSEHDNCAIVHRDCPFDYCITDSVTLPLSDPDTQCSP